MRHPLLKERTRRLLVRIMLYLLRPGLPLTHPLTWARLIAYSIPFIVWLRLKSWLPILLAILVDFASNPNVHGKLKRILRPPRPDESGTSKAEISWPAFNHSTPLISWTPVVDALVLRNLHKVFNTHFGVGWTRWYIFDELLEQTHSRNFRVVRGLHRDPVFMRLHVAEREGVRLSSVQKIRAHVLQEGVFADSPVGYCLKPIAAPDGKTLVEVVSQFRLRDGSAPFYCEFFPYVHDVTHYSGTSLEQLLSFAQLFGRLQKSISTIGNDLLPLASATKDHYEDEICNIESDISFIDQAYQIARRKREIPAYLEFWQSNRAGLIQAAVAQWKYLESLNSKTDVAPLMHDVHPHNTFFRGDKCVLIYDFEQIDTYSHGDALAFSIHRFVREFVRHRRDRAGMSAVHEIPKAVKLFVEHYSSGFESELTDGFLDTLDLRITKINLTKLRHVMMSLVHPGSELGRRPASTLFAEARKFVACLEEARHFCFRADRPT